MYCPTQVLSFISPKWFGKGPALILIIRIPHLTHPPLCRKLNSTWLEIFTFQAGLDDSPLVHAREPFIVQSGYHRLLSRNRSNWFHWFIVQPQLNDTSLPFEYLPWPPPPCCVVDEEMAPQTQSIWFRSIHCSNRYEWSPINECRRASIAID